MTIIPCQISDSNQSRESPLSFKIQCAIITFVTIAVYILSSGFCNLVELICPVFLRSIFIEPSNKVPFTVGDTLVHIGSFKFSSILYIECLALNCLIYSAAIRIKCDLIFDRSINSVKNHSANRHLGVPFEQFAAVRAGTPSYKALSVLIISFRSTCLIIAKILLIGNSFKLVISSYGYSVIHKCDRILITCVIEFYGFYIIQFSGIRKFRIRMVFCKSF